MSIEKEPHLSVIEAREILTRIENGDPVIYDHVSIAGDIDISQLDLPLMHEERAAGEEQTALVVASRIQIRNCEFQGDVNFAHALLREKLDLCGSTFRKEARFKGASFLSGAEFEFCRFQRYATFRNAHFAGQARFQGSCFLAIANFGNAGFDGPASFGSARFSELCTNFGEVKIRDDADFTQAQFSGTANFRLASFGKSASFWKAGFLADANFQGAKFAGYASFQSASLLGNSDFRSACFCEELNMEFSSFQGNAVFLGCTIGGNANFFRAHFREVSFIDAVLSGYMQFSQANLIRGLFSATHFQRKASFQGSCFQEDALFQSATFQEAVDFSQSQFKGRAVFEQAVFAAEAQFNGAIFLGDADLRSVRFCKEASFISSEFQATARYDSAGFLGEAVFWNAQFSEIADFSGSDFQKSLNLAGTRVHIMRLIDATFAGQVNLNNADFSRLEARWPALCQHIGYDGAAYLALVRNFRNLEWFEDADDCYYHYRRMSQSGKAFLVRGERELRINWSKLLDGLAWISCGYGVRPRYTVFLSCFLIMLFALLFWAGEGIVVEPLNGSTPSIGPQDGLNFLDNVYFSAMVFTAKTQVKWYPVGVYRYLATVESVLGWLLLALFLVSLGRTMIR